jgi:hypothetical protein
VRLSPLGTAAITGLLYQPQMMDDGDCGAIGGIKVGRGNRSTRRRPASAPLFPPQIPLDQTRARTRTAAVGSQKLTAWAMARPNHKVSSDSDFKGLNCLPTNCVYHPQYIPRSIRSILHGYAVPWHILYMRTVSTRFKFFENLVNLFSCVPYKS